jgi:hypothetical protein
MTHKKEIPVSVEVATQEVLQEMRKAGFKITSKVEVKDQSQPFVLIRSQYPESVSKVHHQNPYVDGVIKCTTLVRACSQCTEVEMTRSQRATDVSDPKVKALSVKVTQLIEKVIGQIGQAGIKKPAAV